MSDDDSREWINPDVDPGTMAKVDVLRKQQRSHGVSDSTPPEAIVPGSRRALRSSSYLSVETIIRQNLADVLDGRELYYDKFSGKLMLGRSAVMDNDISIIRSNIESRLDGGFDKDGNPLGLKATVPDIFAAIEQVGRKQGTDPLLNYLLALVWDNVPRLETLTTTCLGAEPSLVNRMMIRKWFISAVARAFLPGCKVDTMLVFVSRQQGLKKSTFAKVLSDPWAMDSIIDVHSKDAPIALRGKWICEWPEMETLKRRDASAVKAFISSAHDTYRPPYGRYSVTIPRSCVFFGSTNEEDFLSDSTGNRRYWPIRVNKIDTDYLEKYRDQLWAEAVRYQLQHQEPWWFDDEESIEMLEAVQESHREQDPWESIVDDYLAGWLGTGDVTTQMLLAKAIEKPAERRGKADEMRIGGILRKLGYRRHKNEHQWIWLKK